jgi:hypothetical protein
MPAMTPSSLRLVLLLSISITVSCSTNTATLVLANESSEPITSAIVTVCRQEIILQNVQPKQSARASYKVKSDSHYSVTITFRSGKTLQREMGYVTPGFDFSDQIIVTESDVKLGKHSVI